MDSDGDIRVAFDDGRNLCWAPSLVQLDDGTGVAASSSSSSPPTSGVIVDGSRVMIKLVPPAVAEAAQEVCTYARMHIYMYVCMYTYVCMHLNTYACMRACMYVFRKRRSCIVAWIYAHLW